MLVSYTPKLFLSLCFIALFSCSQETPLPTKPALVPTDSLKDSVVKEPSSDVFGIKFLPMCDDPDGDGQSGDWTEAVKCYGIGGEPFYNFIDGNQCKSYRGCDYGSAGGNIMSVEYNESTQTMSVFTDFVSSPLVVGSWHIKVYDPLGNEIGAENGSVFNASYQKTVNISVNTQISGDYRVELLVVSVKNSLGEIASSNSTAFYTVDSKPRIKFVTSFSTDTSENIEKLSEESAAMLAAIGEPEADFQVAADRTDRKWYPFYERLSTASEPPTKLNQKSDQIIIDAKSSKQAAKNIVDFLRNSAKTVEDLYEDLAPLVSATIGGGGTTTTLFSLLSLEVFDPAVAGPITLVSHDAGWAYGNLESAICQNKNYKVNVNVQVYDFPDENMPAYAMIYSGDDQLVYQHPITIKPVNRIQDFSFDWNGRDQNGQLVAPGGYRVVVSPANADGSAYSTKIEGVVFGLRLINPTEKSQEYIDAFKTGNPPEYGFSTLRFTPPAAHHTQPLKETYFWGMDDALSELDQAANNSPGATIPGLGLEVPGNLYSSTNLASNILKEKYVSYLTTPPSLSVEMQPYMNLSLYDLTGLLYFLYKGEDVLGLAIDNTECRKPHIHTFLKTVYGLEDMIRQDVDLVRPPIELRNSTIAEHNDVIHLIADTPTDNRLSFSNALDSLHYPEAVSRRVSGPGGIPVVPGPSGGVDVKFFNANGFIIWAREHKTRIVEEAENGNALKLAIKKAAEQAQGDPDRDLRNAPQENQELPLEIIIQFSPLMSHEKVVSVTNRFIHNQNGNKTNCAKFYDKFKISGILKGEYVYEKWNICQ